MSELRGVGGGEEAEVESIWSGGLPGVAWASLERWLLQGPRLRGDDGGGAGSRPRTPGGWAGAAAAAGVAIGVNQVLAAGVGG